MESSSRPKWATGPRRLALALLVAWCLGVVAVAGYELLARRVGTFVELSLPVGSIVNGDKATLPDGRVVDLQGEVDVGTHEAGEIRRAGEPQVTELRLRTLLLLVALGVPVALFLGMESLAVLVRWILRGFRPDAS